MTESSCPTCRRGRAKIGEARSEVLGAVRRAERTGRPEHVAAIAEAKAKVAGAQDVLAQHEATCTWTAPPPAPPAPRVLAADDHRHGTTNGYNAFRCRCDPCRKAASDYGKARRYSRPRARSRAH